MAKQLKSILTLKIRRFKNVIYPFLNIFIYLLYLIVLIFATFKNAGKKLLKKFIFQVKLKYLKSYSSCLFQLNFSNLSIFHFQPFKILLHIKQLQLVIIMQRIIFWTSLSTVWLILANSILINDILTLTDQTKQHLIDISAFQNGNFINVAFKNLANQFACFTNNNNSLGAGRYQLNSAMPTITVNIDSLDAKISLTIAKYDNTPSTVKTYFETLQTLLDLISISLGAMGGLMFLIAIFGVCYLIRNPTKQQVQNLKVIKQTLSVVQIKKYFPTVTLQSIYLKYQKNQANERLQNQQNKCLSCLSQIQLNTQIKIGYCHHMFHEKCMLQILKTKKKCPCCLQQFIKSKVLSSYEHVKGQNNFQNIQGVDLAYKVLKYEGFTQIACQKDLSQIYGSEFCILPLNSKQDEYNGSQGTSIIQSQSNLE